MSANAKAHPGIPMRLERAGHLLNPVRGLVLSPRALVRRLKLRPDAHVLELGPGPGYFSSAVARAVPQGKLVLMDVQAQMLELAKARLSGRRNVEYVCGDACALPFADDTLDAAFLVAMLGEVSDPAVCLTELRRVLKPGGLLSITEMPVFDPDAIPYAHVRWQAEAAGFRCESRQMRLLHFTIGLRKAL